MRDGVCSRLRDAQTHSRRFVGTVLGQCCSTSLEHAFSIRQKRVRDVLALVSSGDCVFDAEQSRHIESICR